MRDFAMKNTAYAVLLFIALLIWAGYSRADDGVRFSLGQSLINSHLKVGSLGYEFNSWEIDATLMEGGRTKSGDAGQLAIYSASYITRPQAFKLSWAQPYMRLGMSYNDGSNLVGRTNFRLGVGVDFSDVWRLEYSHHSSAGIHQTNTGIDYITATYKVPAPW